MSASTVADAVGLVACIAIRNARVCNDNQTTEACNTKRTWLASGSIVSSVAHSTRRIRDAVCLVGAVTVRNALVCLARCSIVSTVALAACGIADAVGLVACITMRNARICECIMQ